MTTKKRSGLRISSPYQFGAPSDPGTLLADMISSARGGADEVMTRAAQQIAAGKLRWEDIDLLGLFRATFDIQVNVRAFMGPALGVRTLVTSMFPVLTGLLTAELLARDTEVPETIWQNLVTTRQTKKKTTHLIRIVNSDPHTGTVGDKGRNFEVEGYPTMASGEDRVQVDTIHDGRRLALSADLIEANDAPGFMEQVIGLREWADNRREIVTLQRVYDLYGSASSSARPFVYRPSGTGAALYTTSTSALARAPSGTRIENNAFVGGDSLEKAIARLTTMTNDDGNKRNAGRQFDIVCPQNLLSKVLKTVGSELTPGVENEKSPYGPGGHYRFVIHSSPKIDDFTTTSWLLGSGIARQFQLVSRIDMEFVSMAATMQDFLRTRLGFEARIADEFEVGAKDHNRVVQSLEATSAPTAPSLGA